MPPSRSSDDPGDPPRSAREEGVPRPAATVMLVRDGEHGDAPMEVLMVRRNLRSDFVGGAYVFPGGGVDPADGGAEAEGCARGRTDAEASEILEVDGGGLAYWVAVLRECFEEAGILLAYTPPRPDVEPGATSDRLLSLAGPGDADRFARHRQEVNGGRRRFLDVCREEGLALAVDRVHYFAHWITPEGAPRRYDTRFFVAAAPPDQTPAHDARETIAAEWIRPADALERHREGDIELIFPTIRNLQAIDRFATSAALLEAAAAAGRVQAVLPRVVVDGRAVRILLPGDPGYSGAMTPGPGGAMTPGPGGAMTPGGVAAGAPGGEPGSDAPDFNEAVRAISRAANPAPGPPEAGSGPEGGAPSPAGRE